MSGNITQDHNTPNYFMGKLEKREVQEYKKTIQKALNLIDKRNLSLIIHGASFPSVPSKNTGIGSPCSEGAKRLIDFIEGMFNSIQLGPGGKTKLIDSSPYSGTIFSNNTLFIDLAQLTEPEWCNILPCEIFNAIVKNNPNKGKNKVAYSYIYLEQENALKEAYKNFRKKLTGSPDKQIQNINKKFTEFKEKNVSWLDKDALYEALSVKHNNDYWPLWNDELDKNLLNPKNEKEKKAADERIAIIKRDYSEEIEFYKFCQFIADVQKEEAKKYALNHGISLIADRQVGFSDRDYWAYQSLFLPGWSLGCPPDYFSRTGQAWGFPVMDPDKIFNKDGSLGEGGKLLKDIFKKIFRENPGGVRIDHIIGLIDPWVYITGKNPRSEEGAGRLYSSPDNEELAKYSRITIEDLDSEKHPEEDRIISLNKELIGKYSEILIKIVISAAQEEGLSKDSIICEDLGTLTYPVIIVLKQLELSGVRVTQFVDPEDLTHPYRGRNVELKHWIMAGTHDNVPLYLWAKDLYRGNADQARLHAKILAEDLVPEVFLRDDFINKILKDPKEMVKAKFAELFASSAQNIQIFFSDFFGLEEIYNIPGTSGEKNWSLRLPDNFEEFYFENLSRDKGVNLPEILKMAIESRGKDFIEKNQGLVKKLEHYSHKFKS